MRRREFIAFISSAAALPLAASAQQQNRPVIGFLSSRSPEESASHISAFRQGLKEIGYVEGDNVGIQYRWAHAQYDRLPTLASELVAQRVTVIAAFGGNVSALAAKAATSTIPIVFIVSVDPVKLGLVKSINRPGGNATGMSIFTSELGSKRLQLLHELVPAPSMMGFLTNPNYEGSAAEVSASQVAAHGIGRQILVLNASTERDIDTVFATLTAQQIRALVVGADALFVIHRNKLVALAERYSIPAIYDLREFVDAGGLVSYGASLSDSYRRVGVYVGTILKGAKPDTLSLLGRADEVIE